MMKSKPQMPCKVHFKNGIFSRCPKRNFSHCKSHDVAIWVLGDGNSVTGNLCCLKYLCIDPRQKCYTAKGTQGQAWVGSILKAVNTQQMNDRSARKKLALYYFITIT